MTNSTQQLLDVQFLTRDGRPEWRTMPIDELLELSAQFRAGGGNGASIVRIEPNRDDEIEAQYAAYCESVADQPEPVYACNTSYPDRRQSCPF